MTISEQDQAKILNAHPFLEYIESIINTLPKFYDHTTLSLLTYRFLPELSQHVINRLLAFKGPIPFQEVRTWFLPAHKAIQNKTLWRLKQLQILQGRGQEVWINESFQRSLFSGFSKGSLRKPRTEISMMNSIDDFARSKWELVLYELVKGENDKILDTHDSKRSRTMTSSSNSSLGRLLKDSGLISETGKVSNTGFQFMLRDVSSQIWTLLIHYLRGIKDNKVFEATLLFVSEQVLFGRPGEPITIPPILNLDMLEKFGLIMRRGIEDSLCATKLFTSLSGSKNSLELSQSGEESRGFLVVETNYRIYAYTSSPLQIAILALFIRLTDRFPNLVYGQLDMETVQGAMAHGITADQIIQYLQINVHPCMNSGNSKLSDEIPFNGIPFTIVDQIRLWEMDRNRISHRDGYLYQQFLSEREFDAALGEAKAINALLYAKPSNRLLIVSSDGHEHMKQFIKSIK